jgi:predicted ATPase
VISSIEITRFRGIREGKLEGLTPLVVLVGPNGCGKSSVLDAVLIGASASRVPDEAIQRAVQRHRGVKLGERWLFWRTGIHGPCEIKIATNGQRERNCRLTCEPSPKGTGTRVVLEVDDGDRRDSGRVTLVLEDGKVAERREGPSFPPPLEELSEARIVEGHREDSDVRLHHLVTKAVQQGRSNQAKAIVSDLVPDVKDVVILTEGDDPLVHLVYEDHSVPAALAGDGVYSLVRLSYELASRPQGTVLIEEPEVHQHPGAIRQTMRAILAAVRRDIQVVLSTHSLELIDSLLADSSEEDLEKLSLYRLQLEDGSLRSHRMSGSEVEFARTQIENDLR